MVELFLWLWPWRRLYPVKPQYSHCHFPLCRSLVIATVRRLFHFVFLVRALFQSRTRKVLVLPLLLVGISSAATSNIVN